MRILPLASHLSLFLVAFLVAALPPSTSAQELPAAEEILDRYYDAIGGREALDSLKYLYLSYEMTYQGSTMTHDTWRTRPARMLQELTRQGELANSTGFDGEVVWSISTGLWGQNEILEGPRREAIVGTSEPSSVVSIEGGYTSFETVAVGTAQDRPCYWVEMTTEEHDGERTACFDVESGLMLSAVVQTSQAKTTTTILDYEEIDGIMIPSGIRVEPWQLPSTEMTLLEASTDPIPSSKFNLPSEIERLREQD